MARFPEHMSRAGLLVAGFRSRKLQTSSGAVHVVEARGRGRLPPIVAMHGFGGAGVHLSPLLRRLRRHVRRVAAPDFPAHGFSDHPGRLTTSVVTDALFEALDELTADEPAVLFGNSMGGLAAARYAARRPERVRAAVLSSPAGVVTDDAELAAIRATFEIDDHDKALQFVDRLFARRQPLRHVVAWGVRRTFTDPGLRSLLDSIGPDDRIREAELSAIAAPVLLLWGARERILPDAHRAFYERHLPDHARVERPAEFGHSPYLERPGELTERIVRFLESLPP
jgi:pimeloyl-ACP methyl ester carboxylesterase